MKEIFSFYLSCSTYIRENETGNAPVSNQVGINWKNFSIEMKLKKFYEFQIIIMYDCCRDVLKNGYKKFNEM